jgi:hypothetical protein
MAFSWPEGAASYDGLMVESVHWVLCTQGMVEQNSHRAIEMTMRQWDTFLRCCSFPLLPHFRVTQPPCINYVQSEATSAPGHGGRRVLCSRCAAQCHTTAHGYDELSAMHLD